MASTTGVSSSLGSASGLDLTGLLGDLRAAEEVKVTNAENKVTLQESKISAWEAIEEAVKTLDTATEALQDEQLFNEVKATTTSTAFTATGTGDIATGDYTIGISQLAQAESVYTNSTDITSKTQVIGENSPLTSIVFRFDGKEETALNFEGDATFENLANAINADSSLGVSATIINTGSSVRLALTSTETGTDAALTEILVFNNPELSDVLDYSAADPSNMTVGTSAQNAIMTINGLEIESQSNTVDDAVEGLSFELTETTSTDAKLTVAQDTDAIVSAITEFVDAYNDLMSTLDQATAFNVDDETQAALTGDPTLRSMINQYKTALQGSGTGSVITNLSGMGIKTISKKDATNKGELEIDTDALNKAVKNNLSDVQSVFQGESGVATNISSYTNKQLETGGFFDNNTENMNAKLKDLEAQVVNIQARVDKTMNIYEDKFIALDASVSSMNSTKAYLEQQFAVLESDD